MKRLFVLFLISALVIGACTALAADWTDGRSAAQPYSGVPEVDLNTTMGYIMMSPRAKLPVNHFCNELQIYLPREDIVAGTGKLMLYASSGNAKAKMPSFIRLTAAPLSVADEMKKCFYDTKDSVVLCSATLRTGDKFDYMARRLGISLVEPPRVKALVATSPFDYFRQALVLAPDCLPDPSAAPGEYAEKLAPFLLDLFRATDGRGLVLFTSYDMMRDVADRTREQLDSAGFRLLVQGEGESREAMAEALRTAERPTVLFGAQSFWEGVDVPGEALSCVVLARLPFPQVGEPIVEARGEKVAEEGGSAFRDYLLPEAIIRFRQGFGRLVRTKSDRGVVVVTDSRIVTKNYGALFRKAIPASVHAVTSLDELISRTSAFFGP